MNTLIGMGRKQTKRLPMIGKWLVRKWDWWIYCQAHRSLKRMASESPGFSYLLELHIRGWNDRQKIPQDIRDAAERFYEAMGKIAND